MASCIPDRWIPYKACGSVIEGTRLISFKVPLRRNIQEKLSEIEEIWDVNALLKQIPNLGAVIDLTNTTRYYSPQELIAAGVLYKKIFLPGRIIPSENRVTEFMNVVDEFLRKDPDSVIGVHCTHGLNRTGYMVCRYMRDRLGMPAKDAIEKFEKARGYHIERENYIADLLGQKSRPPSFRRHTNIKPVPNQKNFNEPPVYNYRHNKNYKDRRNHWRKNINNSNNDALSWRSRGSDSRHDAYQSINRNYQNASYQQERSPTYGYHYTPFPHSGRTYGQYRHIEGRHTSKFNRPRRHDCY